jgi:hypothetical protein
LETLPEAVARNVAIARARTRAWVMGVVEECIEVGGNFI